MTTILFLNDAKNCDFGIPHPLDRWMNQASIIFQSQAEIEFYLATHCSTMNEHHHDTDYVIVVTTEKSHTSPDNWMFVSNIQCAIDRGSLIPMTFYALSSSPIEKCLARRYELAGCYVIQPDETNMRLVPRLLMSNVDAVIFRETASAAYIAMVQSTVPVKWSHKDVNALLNGFSKSYRRRSDAQMIYRLGGLDGCLVVFEGIKKLLSPEDCLILEELLAGKSIKEIALKFSYSRVWVSTKKALLEVEIAKILNKTFFPSHLIQIAA